MSFHINRNTPRAAVLRVPKGRFLPDIGSHTSISPSSIMLGLSIIRSQPTRGHTLLDPTVKGCINIGSQTACPNMAPVKIRVVLSFPYTDSDDGASVRHRTDLEQ